MTPEVLSYPLEGVSHFVVNQTEGATLAETNDVSPETVVGALQARLPNAAILLTLGGDGSLYARGGECIRTPAVAVNAVDTTAAGDTFIGYFLAELLAGRISPEVAGPGIAGRSALRYQTGRGRLDPASRRN